MPIDNLPFVFFRIVVGGHWALLTPPSAQCDATLTIVSAAASFIFRYICSCLLVGMNPDQPLAKADNGNAR